MSGVLLTVKAGAAVGEVAIFLVGVGVWVIEEGELVQEVSKTRHKKIEVYTIQVCLVNM